VTKDGAIVYAAGPTLSISSLARLLVAAGAVRAMEMDINVDWVQYSYFSKTNGLMVNGGDGTSLLNGSHGTAAMAGTASRYFVNWWTRDFYTMSLR